MEQRSAGAYRDLAGIERAQVSWIAKRPRWSAVVAADKATMILAPSLRAGEQPGQRGWSGPGPVVVNSADRAVAREVLARWRRTPRTAFVTEVAHGETAVGQSVRQRDAMAPPGDAVRMAHAQLPQDLDQGRG